MELMWDGWAVWAVCFWMAVCTLMMWLRKRWQRSAMHYSGFWGMQPLPTWRGRLAELPQLLAIVAGLLFLVAFVDFHRFDERANGDSLASPPLEGLAIYLVLDNSGSMNEANKMEQLKEMTDTFINGDSSRGLGGRPHDLIGLVSFARGAQVVAPLTQDHKELRRQLRRLSVNRDPEQVGTAIGYAIFKTVNLIAATRHYGQELVRQHGSTPAYEIKESVIILVTDGFQEIHPDDAHNERRNIDLFAAAEYARDQAVRLYIINIDPKLADEDPLFDIVAQAAGGRFFSVDDDNSLAAIYRAIDTLEKSRIPAITLGNKELLPHLYDKASWNSSLLASGVAALLIACVLETTLFRRVR